MQDGVQNGPCWAERLFGIGGKLRLIHDQRRGITEFAGFNESFAPAEIADNFPGRRFNSLGSRRRMDFNPAARGYDQPAMGAFEAHEGNWVPKIIGARLE